MKGAVGWMGGGLISRPTLALPSNSLRKHKTRTPHAVKYAAGIT